MRAQTTALTGIFSCTNRRGPNQAQTCHERKRLELKTRDDDTRKAEIEARLKQVATERREAVRKGHHRGRPSAPALRLLEPHALAAVTNIAWLEEYDPRLLERPLKCLKRACPQIGSPALDILDRDLG
jgi:hypothetical protein